MKTTFYDFIRTYDEYFFLFVFQNGESYSNSDFCNVYRRHYNIDFPVGSKIFTDSGGYLKSYCVQPNPKMSSYWTVVSLDDVYVKFNSLDSLNVSIYEFGNDGNVVVVYTENDEQTNQVERCMTTLTRDCEYKDEKDVVQWLWDFIKREDLDSSDGVKLDDFCVQHDAGPTVLLNTIQWLNDFNWYDRDKVNIHLNMNFGRFNLILRDYGVNYFTGNEDSIDAYVEEVKNYFGNDAKVEFKPSSNGYWGNVSNPSNFSFDRPGFILVDYEADIVQNITSSRRKMAMNRNDKIIKGDDMDDVMETYMVPAYADDRVYDDLYDTQKHNYLVRKYFKEGLRGDDLINKVVDGIDDESFDWDVTVWHGLDEEVDMFDPQDVYDEMFMVNSRMVRSEKVLEGKQKDDIIKKAMKMQGYSDKEANQMVSQGRNAIKSAYEFINRIPDEVNLFLYSKDDQAEDKRYFPVGNDWGQTDRLMYAKIFTKNDIQKALAAIEPQLPEGMSIQVRDAKGKIYYTFPSKMVSQGRNAIKSALSGKEWYDYVFNLGYDSYFKNESYKDARDPTWGGEEREAWYNGYSAAMQDERDDDQMVSQSRMIGSGKVTNSEINFYRIRMGYPVINLHNSFEAQFLLTTCNKEGYNSGVYGWNYDMYYHEMVGRQGYVYFIWGDRAPVKNYDKVDMNLVKELGAQAQNEDAEGREQLMNELIENIMQLNGI